MRFNQIKMSKILDTQFTIFPILGEGFEVASLLH